MQDDRRVEAAARAIAPLAWAALGLHDTLAQANRRKASLKQARAALAAADAVDREAGFVRVPQTLSRPMEDTLEECMAAWVDEDIDADMVWERTIAASPERT